MSWPHLVGIGLLAPFAASALGLALGTLIEPRPILWLQVVSLLNPSSTWQRASVWR